MSHPWGQCAAADRWPPALPPGGVGIPSSFLAGGRPRPRGALRGGGRRPLPPRPPPGTGSARRPPPPPLTGGTARTAGSSSATRCPPPPPPLWVSQAGPPRRPGAAAASGHHRRRHLPVLGPGSCRRGGGGAAPQCRPGGRGTRSREIRRGARGPLTRPGSTSRLRTPRPPAAAAAAASGLPSQCRPLTHTSGSGPAPPVALPPGATVKRFPTPRLSPAPRAASPLAAPLL